MTQVCSSCFGDMDLRAWIRENGGPRGCKWCGGYDSPTLPLNKVIARILECLSRYYGRAENILPWNGREGGYLGPHWDSWDLFRSIGFDLPRDDLNNNLFREIASSLQDYVWCPLDPGVLDLDIVLNHSWFKFCDTIKHHRRFFFQDSTKDSIEWFSPTSLLNYIAEKIEDFGLLTELPTNTILWRARTGLKSRKREPASSFLPPPAELSLQSNRMNPPGIPMLYLASSITTALKETKVTAARVGRWKIEKQIRVLDLRTIPSAPGMFSDATPHAAMSLSFLKEFATDIMQPVARDERVHIDYLPSQVATEFFRDYSFSDGPICGILYKSTVHERGWNATLFPDRLNLSSTSLENESCLLSFQGDRWAQQKP